MSYYLFLIRNLLCANFYPLPLCNRTRCNHFASIVVLLCKLLLVGYGSMMLGKCFIAWQTNLQTIRYVKYIFKICRSFISDNRKMFFWLIWQHIYTNMWTRSYFQLVQALCPHGQLDQGLSHWCLLHCDYKAIFYPQQQVVQAVWSILECTHLVKNTL